MSKVDVPKDIRKLSREKATKFYNLLSTPMPNQIEIGQIWSTWPSFVLAPELVFKTAEPRLVVTLRGVNKAGHVEQVAVAPISLETFMATEFDLVLTGETSPLGFDFMIEVWNETPVIRGHLKQYLGKVEDEVLLALRQLYRAQLLDLEVSSSLINWVGLPIVGESDPRLAFQESEISAVTYLSQAATAAMEIGESVQEVEHVLVEREELQHTFNLRPVLAKLSEFFQMPSFASATGPVTEEKTYVIQYQQSDEQMTLELLNSRRPPYTVYLKVHSVSSSFAGRECIIVITTPSTILQSLPTKLEIGAQILVGNDPNFHRDLVENVEVKVL